VRGHDIVVTLDLDDWLRPYQRIGSDVDAQIARWGALSLHLDRAIDLCAAQGIDTIIDLHALPGYQNGDWHADNPTHKALFWQHKHFQDRTVGIWEAIARPSWVASVASSSTSTVGRQVSTT